MRVIIAGSRDTQMAHHHVRNAIAEAHWVIDEIVSGHGGNVDHMAEYVAGVLRIPCKVFKPDWKLGRKAGPLRNKQMADYADALIAIWDGKSKGTKSMIDEATKRGLPVYVYRTDI